MERPDPIGRLLLVKPMKFMNISGAPVRAALRYAQADTASDLLVVADDIDLPLGKIRLRRGGSAGGHNGLRDIIAALGSNEFNRLRVGIGRAGETVDHVLSTFKKDERDSGRGGHRDRGRRCGAVAGRGNRGGDERVQRRRSGCPTAVTASRSSPGVPGHPVTGSWRGRPAIGCPHPARLAGGLPESQPAALRVPAAARAAFLAARRTQVASSAPVVVRRA